MSKELLNTPRAVGQRNEARRKADYVRLLEELEFCVRNKVDPIKQLTALDTYRRG